MTRAMAGVVMSCALLLAASSATAQEPFFQTQPNPPTYGQPTPTGQATGAGRPAPIGPPAAVVRPQAAPQGTGAWPSSAGPPSGALNPHFAYGPDDGLLAAGITIILLGYAPALVGGIVLMDDDRGAYLYDSTYDQTCHQQSGAVSLIPIVGALLGAVLMDTCTVPTYELQGGAYVRGGSRELESYEGASAAMAFGIPSTIVQVIGFGLVLGGALSQHRSLVFDSISWQLPVGRVSIALAAPGSQLGLSVRLDHL